MKKIIVYFLLLNSFSLFSQNRNEIEADYEIQGYFKNFIEFNLDTLKSKKFNYIRKVDSSFGGLLIKRQRDFNITESIYNIAIHFPEGKWMKYKEYKVHIFSENDSIFGLINFDPYREKTNYYFDFDKLNEYLKCHNIYYESELKISDFINQILDDNTYGYICGYAPIVYDVPRYNDFLFDDTSNIVEFKKWIKSFNLELQTYGVDALKYLEKRKKYRLTEMDKKIIENIKVRNSELKSCDGCIIHYKKNY